MALTRASTCGEPSASATRCGASGGIRKNKRNRQPPNRYRQPPDSAPRSPNGQEQTEPSSTSNKVEPSTPRYSHLPLRDMQQCISRTLSPLAASSTEPPTYALPSQHGLDSSPQQAANIPINLRMMQQLLRSHEQVIVDRVLHQLSSRNHTQPVTPSHILQAEHLATLNPPSSQLNCTQKRIQELESQLAELKGQMGAEQRSHTEPGMMSTYIQVPTRYTIPPAGKSGSTMADSVEMLFLGVE